MRVAHVLGPVSLVFLACYANACGSSGTSSGGNDLGSSSGGSSGGYGSSNGGSSGFGTSTSSSGSGDDATLDSPGDDSSGGSSSGVAEGGDDSSGGSSSGSNEGGQVDGPDESGSSSGADSSSSGSSSSGGSSSGGSSSGGSSSGGSSSGGSSSGGVVDSGTTCDLTGAWAVKIQVHVTWPGTTLLAASPTAAAQQPVADIWALIQGTQSGLSIPGTDQGCGLALPDFGGTLLPENYGVTFANSMWDMLTPNAGTVTVSNTSPTATYTSSTDTTLIGIGTTPTAWTTWPSLAVAQADQIDVDHDGHVGVTATPKTGTPPGGPPNYAYPPITANIFALQRTDAIYMTLRSVLSLSGALTSCTAASGNATVSAMDNHIIGCHIQGLGTDAGADFCNSTETTFLDTNSPHLTPHAATFTAVKLTNAATCTNVRAALP